MDCSSLRHCCESIYSHPIDSNTIQIRLQTKKDDDIKYVDLLFNNKYLFHMGVESLRINKSFCDEYFDYYVINKRLDDTRFAYIFKITLTNDDVFYFSEAGVEKQYDVKKGFYSFFQVPYINKNDVIYKNKKWINRVFYQIFVDRFNNASLDGQWQKNSNETNLAGGNLKGIISELPYIKNLGVDAIYLTPIFESNTNHKYDTLDYYSISKDFGDDDDFKKLIDEIHSNDMVIVLDGVFNHISDKHPFFIDVIKNGKASKYFDWFFIKDDQVDTESVNYATFAMCKDMPRLNLNNKEVQQYIIQVATYYVKKYHIDGFRLDVSDEIPHQFWIEFKKALKEIDENIFLIGENWHNAHAYLNSGYEFDSIMNYSITKSLIDFIALENIDVETFKNRIISNLMRYKHNVNYHLLNLVSSHDILRFYSECNDIDKLILAYAFTFMYIGIPCIYYGDEIGLQSVNNNPYFRTCFDWNKDNWDKKILEYIKDLARIHKKYFVNEEDCLVCNQDNLLIVKRGKLTLYINMNKDDIQITNNNNILLANNFIDGALKYKGFIIKEKRYEK